MRIDVLTLFPEMFPGVLASSLLGQAIGRGLATVNLVDFRRDSLDKHHKVDDRPYGGGPGMVLNADPIFRAVERVRAESLSPGRLILLTPQGRPLTQAVLAELAREPHLILIAGHYEGFDERVRTGLKPDEISIGDYVLTGGELPALVLIDGVLRLLPGVVGKAESLVDESFSAGRLEYPQFTRPEVYRGMAVPEVLLSGDHARVEQWRRQKADERTRERRPDLLLC